MQGQATESDQAGGSKLECHACHNSIPEESVYCPQCGTPVPGAEECQDYTYEAFISYRHLELDRGIAKKLQRFLEGLKLPKRLEATHEKKRLGRLFRDEDELPTSASLSEQIQDALKHSRYLVVVCTPKTPESLWVMREVETFASLHGRDHIIVALAEGEPEESFPPLLLHRYRTASDGTVQLVEEEPIAADFRASQQKKFKDEALRVAAALFGCNYDDLRQRMRARRMQVAAIAATATAVVSLAFGGFSFYQQVQIQENHRISQIHESELLASESEQLLSRGDRYQAIQVALSGLPESSTSGDRPYVPAASLALQRAIGMYPAESWASWTPNYSLPVQYNSDFAMNGDVVVTTTSNETIEVYETLFGKKLYSIDREYLSLPTKTADSYFAGVTLLGDKIVCAYDETIACLEAESGELLWKTRGGDLVLSVEGGTDVVTVVAFAQSKGEAGVGAALRMYDLSDGSFLRSFDIGDNEFALASKLFTSKTGNVIAMTSAQSNTLLVHTAQGDQATCTLAGTYGLHVYLDDSNVYALSGDAFFGKRFVEAFDTALSRTWVHEDYAPMAFNESGLVDASNDAICCINENTGELVVAFSTVLAWLDVKTGTAVNRDVFEKSILTCKFVSNGSSVTYFGLLANGKAFEKMGSSSEYGAVVQQIIEDELSEAGIVTVPTAERTIAYLVGKTASPSRLAVFNSGSGVLADADRTKADWLPVGGAGTWENGRVAITGKTGIHFLDPETFEVASTVEADTLPELDWTEDPMTFLRENGEAYLAGPALDNANNLVLCRILPNGDIAAKTVLEGALANIAGAIESHPTDNRLHFGNNNQLVFTAKSGAVVLDAETLDIKQYIRVDSAETLDTAFCGNNTLLLFGRPVLGSRGHLLLVSLETGETIASDLDDYRYATTDAVSLSKMDARRLSYLQAINGIVADTDTDLNRIAISCSDGRLREFDLNTGSLLWESDESSSRATFAAFVPGGASILLQDERGRCSLVSADDGSVLCSTLSSIHPLKGLVSMDGSTIWTTYLDRGVEHSLGLVAISANPSEFGPLAEITQAVAISTSGNTFLADGSATSGGWATYPIHSLDETIEFGRELIKDHELSDADSLVYQIAR